MEAFYLKTILLLLIINTAATGFSSKLSDKIVSLSRESTNNARRNLSQGTSRKHAGKRYRPFPWQHCDGTDPACSYYYYAQHHYSNPWSERYPSYYYGRRNLGREERRELATEGTPKRRVLIDSAKTDSKRRGLFVGRFQPGRERFQPSPASREKWRNEYLESKFYDQFRYNPYSHNNGRRNMGTDGAPPQPVQLDDEMDFPVSWNPTTNTWSIVQKPKNDYPISFGTPPAAARRNLATEKSPKRKVLLDSGLGGKTGPSDFVAPKRRGLYRINDLYTEHALRAFYEYLYEHYGREKLLQWLRSKRPSYRFSDRSNE